MKRIPDAALLKDNFSPADKSLKKLKEYFYKFKIFHSIVIYNKISDNDKINKKINRESAARFTLNIFEDDSYYKTIVAVSNK